MTSTAAIELERVSRRVGDATLVRELSLTVQPGETFVLIGPSGCGKTTTLKMINRLVEPTSGVVRVGGRDVREQDAADLRRGIGYVIQEAGLFAHYTVRRNVSLVPELLGWEPSRIRARVDELLHTVGLDAGAFGERFPRQLSGGQRQRVGIARALAADPPLVLLDEPFGALDPITRASLQDEFADLSRRLKKTFVLVTHDVFEAVKLGDRIGVMREGSLVQVAAPVDLVRAPVDEFVRSLLGPHRYQLLLMTATLDTARGLGTRQAPGSVSVDLPARASVWQALEAMERGRAGFVRVTGEDAGEARFVSREQLLAAASGPA